MFELSRYPLWFLVVTGLLASCSFDADALRAAGVGAHDSLPATVSVDAGTDTTGTMIDTGGLAADTRPLVAPDVGPDLGHDALVAIDTVPALPDTKSLPDTARECPTMTVQAPPPGSSEFTRWSVTVQATSTDGFCFKTCDTFYGFNWHSFAGRTLTVNGTQLVFFSTLSGTLCANGQCSGDLSEGGVIRPVLPAAINGGYTFQVSAGSSASASFLWAGGSVACP
jgi:hypothetical protein